MIYLPWPPSANAIWRSYRGRVVRSAAYKAWRDIAGKEIMMQRPKKHRGPVDVTIELASPSRRKFDLDNRAKSILDLLVDMRVIEGDGADTVQRLTVSCGRGFVGAKISVESAPDLTQICQRFVSASP
jgi:crossover junction endodeoxyribonuclease RusA